MDVKKKICRALRQQAYLEEDMADDERLFRRIAYSYARMENAIAVLSDVKKNTSLIYYGGVAREIGLDCDREPETIGSIWEDEIYKLIHPDDLMKKHLNELKFYSFVKGKPTGRRGDFHVCQVIRMYKPDGVCIRMLHRMYYLWDDKERNVRYALCLYTLMNDGVDEASCIVDSLGTDRILLEHHDGMSILTEREKSVLRLIGQGMSSRDISGRLSISMHTVSRHRQNILEKLQVRNSVEACKVAREMNII